MTEDVITDDVMTDDVETNDVMIDNVTIDDVTIDDVERQTEIKSSTDSILIEEEEEGKGKGKGGEKMKKIEDVDDSTLTRVLAGRLRDLPPIGCKIVRIFVSSTFTGKNCRSPLYSTAQFLAY